MKQRLLQKEPYVSIWHTLFLASPLTTISVFRNCCTTIMRSSYNRFSMKLDMYSFEYRNLMWIWGREEELCAFSSFFSSPRDKAKNDNAKSNTCEWNPMILKGISVNACKRQTGKLIIYLSFHRCFTIVSIWRTRGRLSYESKRRLIIQ